MADPDVVLVCARCGRRWPLTWRDQPGWLCRNTTVIPTRAGTFYGRPCMGVLTLLP